MRTLRRILMFTILFLALPSMASADGGEDGERGRKLLEKAKNDPQHYARLLQDLQAFRALPEDRQKALRKLDQELHEEDSVSYARLQRVLERYAEWLERLPDADRKKLEAAADSRERLRLIKEI